LLWVYRNSYLWARPVRVLPRGGWRGLGEGVRVRGEPARAGRACGYGPEEEGGKEGRDKGAGVVAWSPSMRSRGGGWETRRSSRPARRLGGPGRDSPGED
jgi:hypothetical protein